MDTDRSIVVHGPVKGICTECGAPLKWAERSLVAPENRTAAQVFIVCKNNHRLLDVFAISTLAASLFS